MGVIVRHGRRLLTRRFVCASLVMLSSLLLERHKSETPRVAKHRGVSRSLRHHRKESCKHVALLRAQR